MALYRAHKHAVDDLVLLKDNELNEQGIRNCLKKHYDHDEIYSYIGTVLISVNPFKMISGLYGEKVIEQYRNRQLFENPPSIYGLANLIHHDMLDKRENHCLIISGESGAGKTEAAKKVMEFVACVSSNRSDVDKVKNQILDSNPLLEAFGNAKTCRNNNSSRFGKYFEINFDGRGDPIGGKIWNYLLERSRLTTQSKGERNFHIFYQLLSGYSGLNGLGLDKDPKSYKFLAGGGDHSVPGMNDSNEFKETVRSMNTMNIDQNSQTAVFQLLAAILHLGNLEFEGADEGKIRSSAALDAVAKVLQVSMAELNNALCNKTIKTGRGDQVTSPINKEACAYSRDTLAKAIYSRIFDYLVDMINKTMESDNKTILGVLDIYGFEIFDNNSFEQLCINFVNEKLQQIFIELTLKAEQEEYNREGVPWTPIEYYNNKPCCDLIESRGGIFALLDEESIFPKATDQTFGDKIKTNLKHQNIDHSFQSKSGKGGFIIKHFAGDVSYDVDGFLDKNKDTLFVDLVKLMDRSQNFLSNIVFAEDLRQMTAAQSKRPVTAATMFKKQVLQLDTALKASLPNYVRCIKPNDEKRANTFNDELCMRQILYLGLPENVRVRRAGWAFRMKFDLFVFRYKMLSKQTWPKSSLHGQDACKAIIDEQVGQAGTHGKDYYFGSTKVFIKNPETIFKLEEERQKGLTRCAIIIQNVYRSFQKRRWYLELRQKMQDIFFDKKERRRLTLNRKFYGDYWNCRRSPAVVEDMQINGETQVLFSSLVVKINKNIKEQKRMVVMTDKSLSYYMPKPEKKWIYRVSSPNPHFSNNLLLKRRIPFDEIEKISVSALADNYIIIHSSLYDTLLKTAKKTELSVAMSEHFRKMGKRLDVNISNAVTYKLKNKKIATIQFVKGPIPGRKKSVAGIVITAVEDLPATSVPDNTVDLKYLRK